MRWIWGCDGLVLEFGSEAVKLETKRISFFVYFEGVPERVAPPPLPFHNIVPKGPYAILSVIATPPITNDTIKRHDKKKKKKEEKKDRYKNEHRQYALRPLWVNDKVRQRRITFFHFLFLQKQKKLIIITFFAIWFGHLLFFGDFFKKACESII